MPCSLTWDRELWTRFTTELSESSFGLIALFTTRTKDVQREKLSAKHAVCGACFPYHSSKNKCVLIDRGKSIVDFLVNHQFSSK